KALGGVDDIIASANRRIHELTWQRKKVETELEFYGGDMKKAPPTLKRRQDEIDQSLAVQKRFIANQEEEKKRINVRFDEELKRLDGLWNQAAAPTPTAAASAPTAKK